jgi:hypothetical protein
MHVLIIVYSVVAALIMDKQLGGQHYCSTWQLQITIPGQSILHTIMVVNIDRIYLSRLKIYLLISTVAKLQTAVIWNRKQQNAKKSSAVKTCKCSTLPAAKMSAKGSGRM